MNKTKIKSRICWAIAILFAVAGLLAAIVPFIFMILNSFKDKFEMLTNGIFALPEKWSLANYKTVLEANFPRYFLNSIIVLVVSLALLLFIAACASYPLSRMKFKANGFIYSVIVACMAIPVHITLIPIFRMSQAMHIYDTICALIGPYVAISVPISVFILTSFMRDIPREIEEAAEIDGCSRFGMFFKIMLPMAKPGLSTLAIYNGVTMWNEYIFAYTLTQNADSRTLPLAVWDFRGQYSMDIPLIMAVLTLTALPMIILFIFAQDKLIKGMTAGAVKG